MRILYDGFIYSAQTVGGINRYFANVIGNLPADCRPVLTTRKKQRLNFPRHPALRAFGFPAFRPGRLSVPLGEAWFRAVERFTRPDVIHPTYYARLSGKRPSRRRPPTVITVWDMIHEIYPEIMDPDGRTAREKKEAVLAADAVICISGSTRTDLLDRIDVSEERVTVIRLASEIDESLSHGEESVPDPPYFLFVGSRTFYKNFDGLCRAMAAVIRAEKDIRLGVVGPPLTAEEHRRIDDLGLGRSIRHLGLVDDRHLARLYRCSLAFVYPSLYEGFGIPVLEAMACGTPVVAADCSSIPEVAGDAAVLFDPRRDDSLAESLLFLLNDPVERTRRIARGRERAGQFSWAETARQTYEVYQSLS